MISFSNQKLLNVMRSSLNNNYIGGALEERKLPRSIMDLIDDINDNIMNLTKNKNKFDQIYNDSGDIRKREIDNYVKLTMNKINYKKKLLNDHLYYYNLLSSGRSVINPESRVQDAPRMLLPSTAAPPEAPPIILSPPEAPSFEEPKRVILQPIIEEKKGPKEYPKLVLNLATLQQATKGLKKASERKLKDLPSELPPLPSSIPPPLPSSAMPPLLEHLKSSLPSRENMEEDVAGYPKAEEFGEGFRRRRRGGNLIYRR